MKILLCIMDGVGIRKEAHGNAVLAAKTPNLNMLLKEYPHTLLEASGTPVGLPEGQMGNSEVGHSNIGAGRIVYQPLQLITNAIKNNELETNEEINEVINHVETNKSNLHILGLLSDGGIHSDVKHLYSIIDYVKNKNIKNIYIHAFTDGRDTRPTSGINFVKELEEKIKDISNCSIASVSGRYYAMDRDNNWDRIKKCYDVIVDAKPHNKNIEEYINNSYTNNVTDEFIIPSSFNKKGVIKNGDGLITFNFRPDRLREIFKSLTNPEFNDFKHTNFKNIKLVTMMPVSDEVIYKNAFELQKLTNTLGEYISERGIKQLRIAETEKYAHVTYFFDGGVEKDLINAERILIPSPKVATYDLKPEMSAYEITDRLLNEIDKFDFIVLNFANGDMVGHTGVFDATVKAVEVVDECVGKLYNKIKELGGTMIITADHGNSDYMLDDDNNVVTSHSTSLVPFIVTDKTIELNKGKLGDIAPTILELMNMDKPDEMTGISLIKK